MCVSDDGLERGGALGVLLCVVGVDVLDEFVSDCVSCEWPSFYTRIEWCVVLLGVCHYSECWFYEQSAYHASCKCVCVYVCLGVYTPSLQAHTLPHSPTYMYTNTHTNSTQTMPVSSAGHGGVFKVWPSINLLQVRTLF